MFGKFKRTKEIQAATEFVKTLDPALQFRLLTENRRAGDQVFGAICPDGFKRVDDLQNVFSIRIDLADPDCLEKVKQTFSVGGVFIYKELLDLFGFLAGEWKRALKTWPEFKLKMWFASNSWQSERLLQSPIPVSSTYQLYIAVSSPTCLTDRVRATITRSGATYRYSADITHSWQAITPTTLAGLKQLVARYVDSRKHVYDQVYDDSLELAKKIQRVPPEKLAELLVINGRAYSALRRRFK